MKTDTATYADVYVHHIEDVPQQMHWAVFENRSVRTICCSRYHCKDTEEFISYAAFFSMDKLKAFIKQHYSHTPKSFRVVQVVPMNVAINVSVEVF